MKVEEYYEKERIIGNTDDITSNPDPDYSQKFYQNIFRFANAFAAHIIEEVREKADKTSKHSMGKWRILEDDLNNIFDETLKDLK